MCRFCLFVFAFVLALTGHCQEMMTSEIDVSSSSSADIVSSEHPEDYTDDMLTRVLSDVPIEENFGEGSVEPTSETVETPKVMQLNYKDSKYWGRYTALRTAGWISLGAGMGFFIGGYAMILGAWACDSDAADGLGVAGSLMLISAPILVVASIPLLGCAYYNRHKAKKMYLNVEATMHTPHSFSPMKMSTPALGLALRF